MLPSYLFVILANRRRRLFGVTRAEGRNRNSGLRVSIAVLDYDLDSISTAEVRSRLACQLESEGIHAVQVYEEDAQWEDCRFGAEIHFSKGCTWGDLLAGSFPTSVVPYIRFSDGEEKALGTRLWPADIPRISHDAAKAIVAKAQSIPLSKKEDRPKLANAA